MKADPADGASRPVGPSGLFHHWRDPDPNSLGDSAVEFLHRLPGPTCIHLTGKDGGRCRALATLLHGNEPSGLFALFEALRSGLRPAVDMLCLVPSVAAAKRAPGFAYRMLPGNKDINRCFTPPPSDSETPQSAGTRIRCASEVDDLASEMRALLEAARPECVVDIHNTSGSSPSFGISTIMEPRHEALISLFTKRMIVTDLRLGSLMERCHDDMPIVTIECGGAEDRESTPLALEGLARYFTFDNVLDADPADMSLEFFHHPMRLELNDGKDIAYAERSLLADGVTLLPSVENYNFGHVDADTLLGFVPGPLDEHLRVQNGSGGAPAGDYFRVSGGRLYPKRKLKLFMVTTNPEIARKDCMFYLAEL